MRKVKYLIRAMDNRDLEILTLHDEQGYSFTEIAQIISNKKTGKVGVTPSRVSDLYRKALERKPEYERKKLKEAKRSQNRLCPIDLHCPPRCFKVQYENFAILIQPLVGNQ